MLKTKNKIKVLIIEPLKLDCNNNPKVKEAYSKVIEACKKYGKTPGMGGVYNEELMSEYIGMGMKFILSGSDLSFMMQSASQRSNKLRSFV